jgi:hypothetical protein
MKRSSISQALTKAQKTFDKASQALPERRITSAKRASERRNGC